MNDSVILNGSGFLYHDDPIARTENTLTSSDLVAWAQLHIRIVNILQSTIIMGKGGTCMGVHILLVFAPEHALRVSLEQLQ